MNSNRVKELYQSMDRLSGNRLGILDEAIKTFTAVHGAQAAAGLAYFVIFSLFPLLLLLVAGGSYFLTLEQVSGKVSQLVRQTIPVSFDLIDQNLKHVLEVRGTVGVIGLITLLWAASGGFTSLAYNINLAWPQARRRSFFQIRLAGLKIVAVLGGLFFLFLILDWLLNLLPVLFANIPFIYIYHLGFWVWFSNLFSWLIIFLLFLGLYHWVPAAHVTWKATVISALIASIAWKLAIIVFAWYLKSGFGQYELVYGSLGAIMALLFLIYILSFITLFGAHLTAANDRWLKHRAPGV